MYRKLMRSNNKMIAGVCAGIAEYLDIDPTVVRVAYALVTVFTAGLLGVVAYAILCVVMPRP